MSGRGDGKRRTSRCEIAILRTFSGDFNAEGTVRRDGIVGASDYGLCHGYELLDSGADVFAECE
jgi:hypothetical protein